MTIAEYDNDIEYLSGKQNLIADLMSLRPNNHEPNEGEVPRQVLIDFSLTVKAATLIFISGRGLAIPSAKEGKSGFIYNLVKS